MQNKKLYNFCCSSVLELSSKEKLDGRNMYHSDDKFTQILIENLKETDHLET
jgi:hypothetical protein